MNEINTILSETIKFLNIFHKSFQLIEEESELGIYIIQKQQPRGVPRTRCSENMQQIHRRTPMPNCDFNKVAFNFIEIALRYVFSPVKLLHIFRTTFLKNTFGLLLLIITGIYNRYTIS